MFNKTYALHIITIYVENILYFYVLNASEHVPCVLEVISCVEELHTLYIVMITMEAITNMRSL